MSAEEKPAQEIELRFAATLEAAPEVGGWTVIVMPTSGEFFGTRKAVKVGGTIDGVEFRATCLPTGNGGHLLPIKAALRKLIGKEAGADVALELTQRYS